MAVVVTFVLRIYVARHHAKAILEPVVIVSPTCQLINGQVDMGLASTPTIRANFLLGNALFFTLHMNTKKLVNERLFAAATQRPISHVLYFHQRLMLSLI